MTLTRLGALNFSISQLHNYAILLRAPCLRGERSFTDSARSSQTSGSSPCSESLHMFALAGIPLQNKAKAHEVRWRMQAGANEYSLQNPLQNWQCVLPYRLSFRAADFPIR
jgi:hypothetical protein